MPKLKISPQEIQNREFLAALRAGQARRGEMDKDVAAQLPDCKERTYYRRIKNPETLTLWDLRVLAKRYGFTDYQLCLMTGVEYHGSTQR